MDARNSRPGKPEAGGLGGSDPSFAPQLSTHIVRCLLVCMQSICADHITHHIATSVESPIHTIRVVLHDIIYSFSTPLISYISARNDGRSLSVIYNSIRMSTQDSGQTRCSGRSFILLHLPGIDHGPTSDEHGDTRPFHASPETPLSRLVHV